MELIINTTENQNIIIELSRDGETIAKKSFEAAFTQAEKLLPEIDDMLGGQNMGTKDIKKITVANHGGSFTALRIGVTTANALAYCLGIPISSMDGEKISVDGIELVKPEYSSEPNITIAKKKLNF